MSAPDPPVRAEVFVRARDGRCVLDRAVDSTEPDRSFLADPERLRTGVVLLEGLGLRVGIVDRLVITVLGPQPVVERAFGIELAHDPADGWRLADGDTRTFPVPAGHALGGVLHSVHLPRPPQPAGRESGEVTFPMTAATWPATDLLLGEVGPSLLPTMPQRLTDATRLGLADSAAATRATRTALRNWSGNPVRRGVVGQIDVARRLHPGLRPQATIVEYAAHRDTGARFDDVWASRDDRARRVPMTRHSGGENLYEWDWSSMGYDQHTRAWTRWFAGEEHRIDELTGAIAAFDRHRADRAAWLADTVGQLSPRLRELAAARPLATDLPDLDEVVANLRTVAPTGPQRIGMRVRLDVLRRWLADHVANFREIIARVRARLHGHATMVGTAFLAVTLDTVPVRLWEDPDVNGRLWREKVYRDQPTVVSGSFGGPLVGDGSGDLTEGVVDQSLRRLAQLREPGASAHRLFVMTAGNAGAAPGPYWSWYLPCTAPTVTDVLTVGGCVPTRGRWVACERTHGYEASLSVGGTVMTLVLPHVCATTMGDAGGAVLYPATPDTAVDDADLRWLVGSGGSLATPIVAAVCALVWSAFPTFTAQEVRTAVLRGAHRLDRGGEHYKPGVPSTVITASTTPSWRACLTSAMDAAAVIRRDGLRTLPTPFAPSPFAPSPFAPSTPPAPPGPLPPAAPSTP